MKKATKITLGVVGAVAVTAATAAATALVSAWGDNSGGRASYTIDQINNGALGDKITLNSISDNPNLGDEKNFVGAKLVDSDSSTWNADTIQAVDGETYWVRAYVHNNSPKGYEAVAEDVTVSFDIAEGTGTSVEVQGIVTSSNASPSKYWDSVYFTSDVAFHLEYVSGSAELENNGIGANGGVSLSDAITSSGTLIGYDALDGKVPGCFQYANYVGIQVKVVYDYSYTVDKQVRLSGSTGSDSWTDNLTANIGDEVEFQIAYRNLETTKVSDVMVKDVLPANLEYVEGSTVVYNATYPSGATLDDGASLFTTGINIGSYASNANAYIRFKAKVVDDSLACGTSEITNWGQVGTGTTTKQDSAVVTVNKTCEDPEEADFTVAKTVRKAGDTEWVENVSANIGETVEFKVAYTNTGDVAAKNVTLVDTLPANLEYVAGSTKLNGETTLEDGITGDGINIGDFEAGKTVYVAFQAKVVDTSLECNTEATLTNWASATSTSTVDGSDVTNTKKDSAAVLTSKTCTDPVDPDDPADTDDSTTDTTDTTPSSLPDTGPAITLTSIVGAGSLTAALGCYLVSRKKLQ